jgi:ATP-dependent Clp protease adaptor protein ClpS
MTTQAPTRKPRTRRPGEGTGGAWRVIVLNDDHNTFQGVAFALASVLPSTSYEQGMEMANRIHNSGQAVVWSGHQEAAELYWNQLEGHGLTMAPLEKG